MEKDKDLQIFCYTHILPEYGLINDEVHTPLHVGKELHKDVNICETCDNTGDNISDRNEIYRELTGMYWVWKNVHDIKYVGSEHYRRRWPLTKDDILNILSVNDIIIFDPIKLNKQTLVQNYFLCHSPLDIFAVEHIIKRYYPEYATSWDKYIIRGDELIGANCFISTKEFYDGACEFIFGVLERFIEAFNLVDDKHIIEHIKLFGIPACPPDKQKIGWDWIKYQKGICGFICERLLTLYIKHNNVSAYPVSINKMENF